MPEIFRVSQSKLRTWRRCHRQYYYQHILKLTRRAPPNPLVRGTIIHSMIENFISGLDPWKAWAEAQKTYGKLFKQEREEYGDIPGDIEALMHAYFRWYEKDPLSYYEVDGHYAEHFFQVPLTPGIIMEGTIDSSAYSRDKRFWMVEHKSHKEIPRGDIKYSDIQSGIYTWVMPQIGLPKPDGVMWNYIRMKRPTVPEPLKNGEMSRRDIDTTWEVYETALKKAKLNPRDYLDMKSKLAGKEGEFFIRVALPISKVIQENLIEEAVITAREIKRKAGIDKTRNIDRHCTYCSFYMLCQAQLRGLDDKAILKLQFKQEEKDRYADKQNALTPERFPKTQGGKKGRA